MRFLWGMVALSLVSSAHASMPLTENQRVKVRGVFDSNAVVAESVRRKDPADDDLEVVGRVEARDGSDRIRLHGVWVAIDEEELDRRSRIWLRRLAAGDWVRVEGEWQEGGAFVADTVERPGRKRRVDAVEGLVRALDVDPSGRAVFRIGPFAVNASSSIDWRGF